jgi:hypothetical protein
VQAGGESVTQEARTAQGGGEEEAEGHSHAHGQAAEHARPAAKVIPLSSLAVATCRRVLFRFDCYGIAFWLACTHARWFLLRDKKTQFFKLKAFQNKSTLRKLIFVIFEVVRVNLGMLVRFAKELAHDGPPCGGWGPVCALTAEFICDKRRASVRLLAAVHPAPNQ